jgi:acyl dehydratase
MRLEVPFVVDRFRVEAFAHASGDAARHHLDEDFAASSPLQGAVAHGVLLLGFVSAVSSMLLERVTAHYVTTGYDGVRFRRPVLLGDHVTVRYEVVAADPVRGTSTSDFAILNGQGQACCIGRHLMKRLAYEPD